ncbi:MAG: electron transfer flavoprotein alpha/ beta subunit [Chloroflexi bacterium]|nr:electron transfer flavoprotein alpha/ beta subunit [Chloroflexota bacterium]
MTHSFPLSKLAVCIKQVPVAAAVEFDELRGTIQREGVPSEVSSFDVRALLGALLFRHKEAPDARLAVYTMGPPQAVEALRYCLALGADEAFHLCDRAFAGSDTLATARALSDVLRRQRPDIAFFGRNSTDSETGHVGAQVAELLGWPQITAIQELHLLGPGRVSAVRQIDEGMELVQAELPVIITAAEDFAEERYPSKEEREQVRGRRVVQISLAELDVPSRDRYGFSGSPTMVDGIRVVSEPARRGILLENEDLATQLRIFQEFLASAPKGVESRSQKPLPAPSVGETPDARILVVTEMLGRELRPVSLELLGKAAWLGTTMSAQVEAFVMGPNASSQVPTLAAHGASVAHVMEGRGLVLGTEELTHVLSRLIAQREPRIVVFPSTSASRDVAPRVAARLDAGLTSDCVDLEIDESGTLVQHKAAFGDNAVALIRSRTLPEMATVRPGMLEAAAPDWSRRAAVMRVDPNGLPRARTSILERIVTEDQAVRSLESDETVIGVGMGIGSVSNISVVERLAKHLGAGIGATRKVADAGWLPRQCQVGLSGRAVSPEMYIALGVRGAYEHIVGMRRSGIVIAVNNDPDAMIFDHADLGIVQDCMAFITRLLEPEPLDVAAVQFGR